jgi:hypothetical protein
MGQRIFDGRVRGAVSVLAFGALLASACGGSPVEPDSPQPVPSASGTYHFAVTVDSSHNCAGALDRWTPFGPAIGGTVILSDGVARAASPADGTFEMHFDEGTVGDGTTTGTVSGRLAHFLDFFTSSRRSVTFAAASDDGPSRFTLEPVPGTVGFLGTVTGTIVFTAADASVVSCPRAFVTLIQSR